MKIALIQIPIIAENIEDNFTKIIEFTKKSKSLGAELIVFPETTLTDYVRDIEQFSMEINTEPIIQKIKQLAEKLSVFISFGTLEKEDDKKYITQIFIGPNNYFYKYRKTWIYSTKDESKIKRHRNEIDYLNPGSGPDLFTIKGIKCSCMICADGNSKKCLNSIKKLKPQLVFFPNNREMFRKGYKENIAKEIDSTLLVINRISDSWGVNCEGGTAIYSNTGKLISSTKKNSEEILIYDFN